MHVIVNGLIHPASGGWQFEQVVPLRFSDGRWQLIVRKSQFHLIIQTEERDDYATFLNEITSVVQGCLDSLGFHLATPLRAEVLSMNVIESGLVVMRSDQWRDLLPDADTPTMHVSGDVLDPYVRAATVLPLLRLALADLRSAMELADDTAVLCYRAIESIRQHFLDRAADAGSSRRQSWARMHAALETDEAAARSLEEKATPRRHGELLPLSENERIEVLRLARDSVARFVAYWNAEHTA